MSAQDLMGAKCLKELNYLFNCYVAIIHILTGIRIITIVQISKLATWQKRLIYSSAGLLVRHIAC